MHIVIAAILAIPARANVAIAAACTLVVNPLTIPPMYYAAYRIGSWELHHDATLVTVLLLVTAFQARDYFVTFAQNPSAQREYRPTATAMGERARELASDGIRVTCVVTGNANVVNYLTHDFHEVVEVLEYLRPSTQEIPLLLQFRPQVILLEHDPGFNVFRAAFMLIGNSQPRSGFDEFTLHSSRE